MTKKQIKCTRHAVCLPLVLAFILAATSISSAAEVSSYCSDPDRVARWERLSRNNPHDYGIQTLDALRIGLCQKVDRGALSHREMLELFWASRSEMLAMGVSRRMEDFLEKEAYRDHQRQLLEEKVERLRQEHLEHLRRYEDLTAEINSLNREIRDAQDDYRRRCDTPEKAAQRRCEKIQQDIVELSEEVSDVTEDSESERERERAAFREYEDARQELE